MNAQGASSAMSAASAIAKHLADWLGPEIPTRYFSMGVPSDGNRYGVPDGLFYSFPCRRLPESGNRFCHQKKSKTSCSSERTHTHTHAGEYEIVNGIELTQDTRDKMNVTTKELSDERVDALAAMSCSTEASPA